MEIENSEQLTTKQIKNQVRAQKIIEGLRENKTYTQIAEELDISRPTLYSLLDQPEAQKLMLREIREHETLLIDSIHKMLESESPTDRRTAQRDLKDYVKFIMDKGYPSLLQKQTVNLNVEVDLERIQRNQKILEETLDRLPLDHVNLFWEIFNQVKKEHQK